MVIVCIILTLLVIAGAIYYFEFYKKGKINEELGNQLGDVAKAAKGKKRQGRKPKNKK